MSDASLPLIAGAGPVGLAAALFLRRNGVETRIIDAAASRPPYSRALAVNPRTLELLEPTGVTDQILAIGLRINGAMLWLDDRLAVDVNFKGLRARHPYMVALSQGVSERLLHEALVKEGGHVERGVALANCRPLENTVEIETGPAADQPQDKQVVPWLLAADGAHSVARHRLNVAFPGDAMPTPWQLIDVPLETSLAEDRAHLVFFRDGGFLFLMRVIGDAGATSTPAPLWRVMGNVDPLAHLTHAKVAGPVVWSSSFHIAHRINASLQVGQVYFAGDAAHLHSPVGARGMNLGIEDAWVFAELVKRGKMQRYGTLRHKADSGVVRRIRRITKIAIGESAWSRFVRSKIVPRVGKMGFLQTLMQPNVTGLDHPIEL